MQALAAFRLGLQGFQTFTGEDTIAAHDGLYDRWAKE